MTYSIGQLCRLPRTVGTEKTEDLTYADAGPAGSLQGRRSNSLLARWLGGGGTGDGLPWISTMSKHGWVVDEQFADGSEGPVSPQRCGRPDAWVKFARSWRVFELPDE